ncbi:hypothetical protein HDV02_000404, partial [Globomyces sp. JEL0801]
MELHHSKHHQGYVNNLNAAEEKLAQADLQTKIALQQSLKFNGGGHINHSYIIILLISRIFWTNLAPVKNGGGQLTDGTSCLLMLDALLQAINRDFGSLDHFKSEFAIQAAGVQGSGWGWLGFNTATKKLEIATTFNQDPLI